MLSRVLRPMRSLVRMSSIGQVRTAVDYSKAKIPDSFRQFHVDEFPKPNGSWKEVNEERFLDYNQNLLYAFVVFSGTVIFIWNFFIIGTQDAIQVPKYINWNNTPTPRPYKKGM